MPRTCVVVVLALTVAHGACWRDSGDAPKHPDPVSAPPPTRPARVLSPELVFETISSSYLPQIRRCYQLFIKKSGPAQGRVTLAFTVDVTGKVVSARADGVAPEITSCITQRMAEWQFAPQPKDAGEATFRIPLQLVTN